MTATVPPHDNLTETELQVRDSDKAKLPPRANLTKLELEFREKISAFASYTDDQIASIPNVRLRALYEGVAASAHDPAVYRAFEVLFEDLAPLRVAGRMIFGKLAQNMDEQYERRNQLVQLSGLSNEEFDQCRTILDTVFGSEHKYLSNSQIEVIKSLTTEHLGKELNLPQGRASQETVLMSLSQQTDKPSEILGLLEPDHKGDSKKSKFELRYDHMVHTFSQWEGNIPQGDGRPLDVLKGCFVGAKNEKVLQALKIVYVDYSTLRFAGDLIFKLVSSLMNRSLGRSKR